ncbi:hypothetical protein Tco_0517102 [Tanacetum coccineum]
MRQRRWIELLSNNDCDIRYHLGKASVILDAQVKAVKDENIKDENLRGMDKEFKTRPEGTRCFMNRSWNKVILKVLPWKGAIRFGRRGKLNPRYIGPFKVLAKIGPVAYRLELPQELSGVHNIFYVSNLKKCLSDESLI